MRPGLGEEHQLVSRPETPSLPSETSTDLTVLDR